MYRPEHYLGSAHFQRYSTVVFEFPDMQFLGRAVMVRRRFGGNGILIQGFRARRISGDSRMWMDWKMIVVERDVSGSDSWC